MSSAVKFLSRFLCGDLNECFLQGRSLSLRAPKTGSHQGERAILFGLRDE